MEYDYALAEEGTAFWVASNESLGIVRSADCPDAALRAVKEAEAELDKEAARLFEAVSRDTMFLPQAYRDDE